MREIKLGHYRHFKGKMYQVLGFAYHEETHEHFVIYMASNGDRTMWVSPYAMFASEVDHDKYPNVEQKYRFEKIDMEEVDYG